MFLGKRGKGKQRNENNNHVNRREKGGGEGAKRNHTQQNRIGNRKKKLLGLKGLVQWEIKELSP